MQNMPPTIGANDGLGLNRQGNALLCYAWGESDRPAFHAAHTLDEVRAFIVQEWLGSADVQDYDGTNSLQRILAELAAHDWHDEGELVWTFEIGGVKLVDASETMRDEVRAVLAGKYGNVLAPFVVAMEAELKANAAKGDRPGWLSMSREVTLLEIYWHTAKLSAAVKNNDATLIREHCADVANMSMMLLDVCGGLKAIDR